MKYPPSHCLSLFGFCFLTLMLFGCEKSDSKEDERDELSEIDKDKMKTFNSQLNGALVGEMKNWEEHWAVDLGDFGADDFKLVMTDTIDPMEMPERNPILKSDPLYPYQLPQPNGNGTMDIFSYKIEAQDGLDQPYLNPDSEVVWYRKDGMKERLLFMGPSGMFEEGKWLNGNEFLVLGYFQEEVGYRPMAWIVDVESHQLWQFQLNKVSDSYLPNSYLDAKIKQVELP
jgi:hypothetical protein